MESKHKVIFGILLLVAGGLLAAEDTLVVPRNVTLTVDAQKTGSLYWNPIDRDDLMGYSVWMRHGHGDFTRLMIPTKVGTEIKKLPMTDKSFLVLKGLGKRDLELAVVAEYESGRSAPSVSVFSGKARFVGPLPVTQDAQAVTGDREQAKPASAAVEPSPNSGTSGEGEESEGPSQPGPGRLRPVMAPPGTFHTFVGAELSWEQTSATGYNTLSQLNRYIAGVSSQPAGTQTWSSTYVNRNILVPISAEYGVMHGLEIGGDIDYTDQRTYNSSFVFGGTDYNSDDDLEAVEASGFDNPALTVKVQPISDFPLRLSVRATFATGARSRLQSWGEYLAGTSKAAGLDDDVSRLLFRVEFGDKGLNPGLFYGASYMPGASESAEINTGSGMQEQSLQHGAEVEGDIGYCFPWWQQSMPGSLALGLSMKSISAGQWLVEGQDVGSLLNADDAAGFRAFTGVPLEQEDQLEIFASVTQNVYAGADHPGMLRGSIDSGGKLSFTVKPDNGWILSVSGGFYY